MVRGHESCDAGNTGRPVESALGRSARRVVALYRSARTDLLRVPPRRGEVRHGERDRRDPPDRPGRDGEPGNRPRRQPARLRASDPGARNRPPRPGPRKSRRQRPHARRHPPGAVRPAGRRRGDGRQPVRRPAHQRPAEPERPRHPGRLPEAAGTRESKAVGVEAVGGLARLHARLRVPLATPERIPLAARRLPRHGRRCRRRRQPGPLLRRLVASRCAPLRNPPLPVAPGGQAERTRLGIREARTARHAIFGDRRGRAGRGAGRAGGDRRRGAGRGGGV